MVCLSCGSSVDVFHVGRTPIAGCKSASLEGSLREQRFDLNLLFCRKCNFVKYEEFDEAGEILKKMYESQHATYSLTVQVSDYLKKLAGNIIRKYNLSCNSRILEIGCNDGSLLEVFRELLNCSVIGIEPSKNFKEAWEARKVPVINEFYNETVVDMLSDKKHDLIMLRHVLEHISNVKEFMRQLSKIVQDGTVLVIEVPYLLTILHNKRIDNISYPHINCFSIRSLSRFLEDFNLGITDFDLVESDGGSILFFIRRGVKTEKNLLDKICKDDIAELLNYIKMRQKTVHNMLSQFNEGSLIGYGAGAKGQHLLHLFSLDNFIEYVIDDNRFFDGMYIPGTKVQIKSDDFLLNNNFQAVINLAPTHSEAIRKRIPPMLKMIDLIE